MLLLVSTTIVMIGVTLSILTFRTPPTNPHARHRASQRRNVVTQCRYRFRLLMTTAKQFTDHPFFNPSSGAAAEQTLHRRYTPWAQTLHGLAGPWRISACMAPNDCMPCSHRCIHPFRSHLRRDHRGNPQHGALTTPIICNAFVTHGIPCVWVSVMHVHIVNGAAANAACFRGRCGSR